MSAKKKLSRKRRSKKDARQETQSKEQVEQEESGEEKQQTSTWMVWSIYAVFGVLILFYLWSAYAAVTGGTFSLFFMLALAAGGFFITVLSRRVQKSGYFNVYRVLSIIFFLLVAVMYFFMSSIDGFLYALLCGFSAVAMAVAVLPFIFKGISIEKMISSGVGAFLIFLIGLLLWGTHNVTSRQKTIGFENVYPFAAVFNRSKKNVLIIGDSRFFNQDVDKRITLRIIKEKHPHEERIQQAIKKREELQKFIHRGKKKDDEEKNKDEQKNNNESKNKEKKGKGKNKDRGKKEKPPQYEALAVSFSWSPDRKGARTAVTAIDEHPGKNTVFTVDLETLERTDIYSGKDQKFTLPWKSRTFPGYTTWTPDGKKFFFLSPQEEETYRVFVGDPELPGYTGIDLDGVISAFWGSDDDLFLITGKKKMKTSSEEEKKSRKVFPGIYRGFFDFIPENVEIYRWNEEMESPESFVSLPSWVEVVKVHPKSGKLLGFGKDKVAIIPGKTRKIETRPFPHVPDPVFSGISQDGKTVLLKSPQNQVKLVNIESGKQEVIETTDDYIKNVTFSGDGKYVLYTSCSDYNFMMFHSFLKVYNLEKKTLDRIVPNMVTASFRAVTTQQYAYFSDPYRHRIYFEQISYRSGWKESGNEETLWVIFPDPITPKDLPAPTGTPSPEVSPAPELSPTVSPLLPKRDIEREDSSPVISPSPTQENVE